MKGHSWHTGPLLLFSKQLVPLVLAHGLKLDKYRS